MPDSFTGGLPSSAAPSIVQVRGGVSGSLADVLALPGSDAPGALIAIATLAEILAFNDASGQPERQRNNTQGTLLALAARTAAITSPPQTNYNARGVTIFINITAASGTGGLTVSVQEIDPVSGSVAAVIAQNTTPFTTAAIRIIKIYPGATGGPAGVTIGGTTLYAGLPLPRTWQVGVAVGDASSYSYSIGYGYTV